MLRVRPLLRLERPDAPTCNEGGEGTLAFGVIQRSGSPGAEYAIHCDACPFVAAV